MNPIALKRVWAEVVPMLSKRARRGVILAIAGSVGVAMLDIVAVLAMYPLMLLISGSDITLGILGSLSDIFSTTSRESLLVALLGSLIGIYIIRAVVTIAFRWWVIGMVNSSQAELSSDMYVRYLGAEYSQHKRRSLPEISRAVSLFPQQVFGLVVLGGISVVTEVISMAFIMIALLVLMPIPALFAMVYFGGAAWLMLRATQRGPRQVSLRLAELDLIIAGYTYKGFQGFRDVRMNLLLGSFVADNRTAMFEQAGLRRRGSMYAEVPKYLLDVVFIVGATAVALISVASSGIESAIALLGTFVAAGTRVLPGINRLVASLNSIRLGREPLRILSKAYADLADETWVEQPSSLTTLEPGDIEISHVSYRYPDTDRPILDDVNFTIPFGSSVAVVGTSGAGKTTLIDVLTGLLKPAHGDVLVEGQRIHDNPFGWFSQISLVPQDVMIFEGTLRENICLGVPYDESRFAQVIESAALQSLIAELPHGEETEVGERGQLLSGGQRQRVGIARALYRNPKYLFLDEATSALDNQIEHDITQALETVRGDVTTIVVAHRLSTVRSCDEIVLLDAGKVVAKGSFESLRENNPIFRRLVELGELT